MLEALIKKEDNIEQKLNISRMQNCFLLKNPVYNC
jgi:hypothetical protein